MKCPASRSEQPPETAPEGRAPDGSWPLFGRTARRWAPGRHVEGGVAEIGGEGTGGLVCTHKLRSSRLVGSWLRMRRTPLPLPAATSTAIGSFSIQAYQQASGSFAMEEDRHAAVIAVITVFTTLTTVAIAARMYARKAIVRSVGLDDSRFVNRQETLRARANKLFLPVLILITWFMAVVHTGFQVICVQSS
jgi:hypothetical protein